MEPWVREIIENEDHILFVDGARFSVSHGGLYAFGGISRQGSTLLTLGRSIHIVPNSFQNIVLPFTDTMGQHSIFHDASPVYRQFRVRTLLEQNGLQQFAVSSAVSHQPMEYVWSLARQHLRDRSASTMDQLTEELAAFWAGLTQTSINLCIDNFVTINEIF